MKPEDSAFITIGIRKNVVHKITNKNYVNLGENHDGDSDGF